MFAVKRRTLTTVKGLSRIEERSVFEECALQVAKMVRKHCVTAHNADEDWVGAASIHESQQACDLLVSLGLLAWRDGLGYLWTVPEHD